MNKFTVDLSDDAKKDLFEYLYCIAEAYHATTTAAKHYSDFIKEFKKLEYTTDIYPIQTRRSLQKYGINVRRLN